MFRFNQTIIRESTVCASLKLQYWLQLTLSNPIFCQPHNPQLLFVLGGKEVGGLLVIILQF
jgi:hypothetical protein